MTVSLCPYKTCPYKRQRRRRHTEMQRRRPYEDRFKDGSNMSTSQGMPRISNSYQKVRSKECILPQTLQRNQPCQPLDLGLLPSRIMREWISVFLSLAICCRCKIVIHHLSRKVSPYFPFKLQKSKLYTSFKLILIVLSSIPFPLIFFFSLLF